MKNVLDISDIRLTRQIVDLKNFKTVSRNTKGRADRFEVEGRELTPDARFYDSLFSKYGISSRFFEYFTEEEVFERITQRTEDGTVQITVDETDNNNPLMLSISAANKELPDFQDIIHTLQNGGIDTSSFKADMPSNEADQLVVTGGANGGHGFIRPMTGQNIVAETAFSAPGEHNLTNLLALPQVTYSRGVMRVLADPRQANGLVVNGDQFTGKYALDIPLDGYGSPSVYIAMLRLVCMNLSIGLTKAFKSQIGLGKDKDYVEAVQRALEGFNDDEGYDILRKKIEIMGKSWASVNECDSAYQILVNMSNKGFLRTPDGHNITGEVKKKTGKEVEFDYDFMTNPVLRKFKTLLGDLTSSYGLAHMGALSTRRKQCLPTGCSLYDLMNFMTEVSTHWTNVEGQRRMQGYVGNLLACDGYDLEGSKEKHSDYKELFLSDRNVANAAIGIGAIAGAH